MKEKQTKLESAINKRAEQKYDEAFGALQTFLNQNPIAREARIIVGDTSVSLRSIFEYQRSFEKYGNGEDAKQKVIQDFEAKEICELHSKLDSLNYLFQ